MLAIGLLVRLPALGGGFLTDEKLQLDVLSGARATDARWYDLWRFYSGVPADTARLVYDRQIPWWSHPERRMAFLRPLSSVLFTGDHALFGRAPLGYHAHSLLWFLAFVAVVAVLYRRTLPGASAAIAVLFLAVGGTGDESCVICTRHYLVAGVGSFAGLIAYLRYREEGYRPGLLLTLLGFAVGLAGGESALQTLGYVAAYELAGATDPWARRARAFAPVAGLAVAYVILRGALGYGTYLQAHYADPFRDPARWIGGVFGVARVALALFFDLEGSQPRDIGTLDAFAPGSPWARWPLLIGVLAALAALVVTSRRAEAHGMPAREARAARFFAIGSALALVPVLGAGTDQRLLLTSSVGSAAVAAIVVRFCWALRSDAAASRAARALATCVALVLVVMRAVVSPVQLALNLAAYAERSREKTPYFTRRVPGEIAAACGPSEDPVLLAEPSPVSRRVLVVAQAGSDTRVTRTGARTFELDVVQPSPRPPSASGYPAAGLSVPVNGGFTIRALEVMGTPYPELNLPRRSLITSERSLDDASLCFLAPQGGVVQRVRLPAIGERMDLSVARAR